MGYFNYFIKCVIRKFVNMIFKPKMFLALLIIIGLLFAIQITSRAEWTDENITLVFEEIQDLYVALIEQLNELEDSNERLDNLIVNTGWISNDVVLIRNTLNEVKGQIDALTSETQNINSKLNDIYLQLESISLNISNIYSKLNENHKELIEKLDENQKQLLAELESDNQAVLEELQLIKESLNGSDPKPSTYEYLGVIYDDRGTGYFLQGYKLDYEKSYIYTMKLYCVNKFNYNKNVYVYTSENPIKEGFNSEQLESQVYTIGTIPAGFEGEYIITYQVPSSNPKYIYFGWGGNIVQRVEVTRKKNGIVESLNDSNSLQQQQNQLQQQQNQLQQEQNDFLSKPSEDSDVSVDSFNNVDSNDITSSGLSGVFNTIYNSITSWNSKDIVLPIPKVNKNITIPANYTENMMSKIGGGVLVNIIHTVYYFIVARFMIYSITGIINSIKSGSILETDTKNNITTDML